MRIDSRVNPPYLVDISAAPPAKRPGTTPAPAANGFDRVELSARGKELAKLKAELAALPELRPERVALAKQTMQYGAYRVDPMTIAQKMMESAGI